MNNYLIQDYIYQAVIKYKDHLAVCESSSQITYEELWNYGNGVKEELKKREHQLHEVVGVLFPKSLRSIVSFIGVLLSGGTYIPMDIDYIPAERIIKIICLSGMKYIITSEKEWNEIIKYSNENKIELPAYLEIIILGKLENYYNDSLGVIQNSTVTNSDIAYILYTSGSTGIPKGVTITHLNSLTFILWAVDYFMPEEGTVFSSHAPFHFDLSVFDIYVSLFTGGCLKLMPREMNNNPKKLLDWIKNNKINYWYSVPSVWNSILNFTKIEQNELSTVKKLLFAGEVFAPKYLKKLMNLLPDASFYNLYGPTETNVCTIYHVDNNLRIDNRAVPIGKACANTEVIVLNDENQLVKRGEKGELFVRGSIVTNGYYKDERKTAGAFIKSPLQHHNNALLYRTGDIVERNEQDEYIYVGRVDHMVKIAGFRVELEEIEHALQEFEQIVENVVVPFEDNSRGNTNIGAIIKLHINISISILDLRKELLKKLPYYMVPEIIFIVNNIHKNANGKIDRGRAKEEFLKILKEEG